MYNKILAPLDGSKLSECSLNHVKAIATGCHVSEVVLLTVLESEPMLSFMPMTKSRSEKMALELEQKQKQIKQKAEDYLTGITNSLKGKDIAFTSVVIPPDTGQGVAEVILNYVENNKVDLIIMSTHGRSGVSRWALGSVTDRIVHYSKTPVLTITPAGCRG